MGHRLGNHLMMKKYNIVVVGGGCIGSSILYSLVAQGIVGLALVDRGRRSTSATASSGGIMRIFHEDPRHTEMAIKSAQLLKTYRAGGLLKTNTCSNGSLYFFDKSRFQSFETSLRLMADAGCCFELVDSVSGRRDFPEFHWREDDFAIYESTGSYLAPIKFCDEFLGQSKDQGAEIIENTSVEHLTILDEGFILNFDSGNERVFARQVILAGGVGMLPMLKRLNIDLPLESKNLQVFYATNDPAFTRIPNYFDRESLEYGRFGSGRSIIISHPTPTRLKHSISHLDLTELSANDCYAPNRQGLIASPPHTNGLTVVSGWGGTAFKFALEIGQRTALKIGGPKHPSDRRIYESSTL